jgi:hypothetical protein
MPEQATCFPPVRTDLKSHSPVRGGGARGGGQRWRFVPVFSLLIATFAIPATAQPSSPPSFRQILAIAEWTPDRFAQFTDDTALSSEQQTELARLHFRLRRMPTAKLNEWASSAFNLPGLLPEPDNYRGDLFHLTGHVTSVKQIPLDEPAATALGQSHWFECQMQLEDGNVVNVISQQVPSQWLNLDPLNAPAICNAVFTRRVLDADDKPQAQLAASRFEWFPTQPQPPLVNSGMALLGNLGVNLAAWDAVDRRGMLKDTDFAAFYETLAAMRKVEADELAQLARHNLKNYAAPFRAELSKLSENAIRTTERGAMLKKIVTEANAGRFSVYPIFKQPDNERGQLVLFDGIVRRAVRVDTSIDSEGNTSDALKRFGIDHYYEVELFTPDSQNLPLVFCVLDLPEGFPTGENLREEARLAGFFFKTWVFHNRAAISTEEPNGENKNLQVAPLLIGHAPIQLAPTTAQTPVMTGKVIGALFALAIVAVWLIAWYLSRRDREFERTTLARLQSPSEPVRLEVPKE